MHPAHRGGIRALSRTRSGNRRRGFTDVEDDSVFIADIQWMKDTGVTAGCNPPTNDEYCPKNNVTREQMSAFMHRPAVNLIVDAATAIEADHATATDSAFEADHAAGVDDADTLSGKAANYSTPAVSAQQ